MSEPNADRNPGSPEAVAIGCTCPVLDNGHGRGYMGQPGIFVFTDGCPVHGSLHDDDGPPSGLLSHD